MKLTKEQAEYIRSKPSFKNEGIISNIFAKLLKTKLKNDKGFMKAVDDYDKAATDLAKNIKKMEKRGIEVPDDIKKLAKMK